jgi:hypothetical protein
LPSAETDDVGELLLLFAAFALDTPLGVSGPTVGLAESVGGCQLFWSVSE